MTHLLNLSPEAEEMFYRWAECRKSLKDLKNERQKTNHNTEKSRLLQIQHAITITDVRLSTLSSILTEVFKLEYRVMLQEYKSYMEAN